MTHTTTHKEDCKMAFGRKDPSCPRCQELINGAEPKHSWGSKQIFSGGKLVWRTKEQLEARDRQAISKHFEDHEKTCDYAKRGIPCVAFDY